ncbi:hypothetical protein [Glycomyces buryatensis]|uniref:LPXTG cell wall anchor domain-containing protein n=1 Tax=Glycomyces buryatensis TaxID=2570927 RepID=A0A4S8QAC9_9ACTN|nr:hypothetical protein [Glycomyces buryatensis]THV41288.1 hypothetical protein FAB82_12025 [Glycomyces buryatensis]
MELKRSFKLAGALGLASAAGLTGALALAGPAWAEVVNIPINPGNVPTLAADWEQSCDQVPDDKAAWEDGWVFVLPAASGADGNFEAVYATYEDELGMTHELSTETDGGVVDGQGDNKAYILAPAGWTLVDASADVNDADDGAQFNLTHACAATAEVPIDEDSPTMPEESSPAPSEGEESPTGEATESTSPAGEETLPTTGTPLTVALVSAAVLAVGGTAMVLLMRRRRAAQDW